MTNAEKFCKLNGIEWHEIVQIVPHSKCKCGHDIDVHRHLNNSNPRFTDAKSILEVMMKREDFIVFIVHLQNDLGYAEIDYRALPIDYILNPDKLLEVAIEWCERFVDANKTIELQDKIKGIALGDYEKGIAALKTVFERRKTCAESILNTKCEQNMSDGIEYLDLCNAEIKKTLFI